LPFQDGGFGAIQLIPRRKSKQREEKVMNWNFYWIFITAYKNKWINRAEFVKQWGNLQTLERDMVLDMVSA
jgi:hypothetical protein